MNPVFCVCVCVRDELFRQSLSRLREQVVKANTLVREANFLAEEMSKLTDYQVTLQIPAANLSANRKVRPLNPQTVRHHHPTFAEVKALTTCKHVFLNSVEQ